MPQTGPTGCLQAPTTLATTANSGNVTLTLAGNGTSGTTSTSAIGLNNFNIDILGIVSQGSNSVLSLVVQTTGAGLVSLNAANTFSGGLTVKSGEVKFATTTSAGTLVISRSNTVTFKLVDWTGTLDGGEHLTVCKSAKAAFEWSADGGKIEAVATAPGTLPTNLSFFTASPDGKLAALVEIGNMSFCSRVEEGKKLWTNRRTPRKFKSIYLVTYLRFRAARQRGARFPEGLKRHRRVKIQNNMAGETWPGSRETRGNGELRVGLVGTGFAGDFQEQCLRKAYGADVRLAGVTSARPESREGFGRERGIPVYDSLEAMLPEVDLVSICSPPCAHEEAIIAVASAGKGIICEKPLTGYFGPQGAGTEYRGDGDSKERMLVETLGKLKRIAEAVRESGVFFGYAENFVYAPSVQKEREIIVKSGAQILRMVGEESHSGSVSPVYGIWRFAGGGSLIGKGCHPLGGILYLKRVEGLARNGRPIRPASVSARTHQITRLPAYRDAGFLRTDYHDIEDYGMMHVVFDDGTVADVLTSEVVLGGIYDYVEVFANNHRTRCRISPTGLVDTYNPRGSQFEDIYLIEKASTREGWSPAAPDEHFTMGYQAELQDFVTCALTGKAPQSDLDLALDVTATIYAAYLSDEKAGAEEPVTQL